MKTLTIKDLEKHPRAERVEKGDYRRYRIYTKGELFDKETGAEKKFVGADTIAEGIRHLDALVDDKVAASIREARERANREKVEEKERYERGRLAYKVEELAEKTGSRRAYENPYMLGGFSFTVNGFISVGIKDMAEREPLVANEIVDWKEKQIAKCLEEITRIQKLIAEVEALDVEKTLDVVNNEYIPHAKKYYFEGIEGEGDNE